MQTVHILQFDSAGKDSLAKEGILQDHLIYLENTLPGGSTVTTPYQLRLNLPKLSLFWREWPVLYTRPPNEGITYQFYAWNLYFDIIFLPNYGDTVYMMYKKTMKS
jgi:hypothetical protein